MTNDNSEKVDKDDEFLSNHTQSMRRALRLCRELWEEVSASGVSSSSIDNIRSDRTTRIDSNVLKSLHRQRRDALTQLQDRLRENDSTHHQSHHQHCHSSSTPIVQEMEVNATQSDDDTAYCSNLKYEYFTFVNDCLQANQPCLIRGLDQTSFARVMRLWGTPEKARQWFRARLGADRLVPIRKQQQSVPVDGTHSMATTATFTLDVDGRATECETVEWPLSKWMAHLDQQRREKRTSQKESTSGNGSLYLKDWHLEQWLEEEQEKDDEGDNSTHHLYSLPDLFGEDILNPFLHATEAGDYRFTYWGPAGSGTDWHSDVLHSFSWSFNVYGAKLWTFVCPPPLENTRSKNEVIHDEGDKQRSLVVQQKAGDCIFVPATWKHRVVNMEETLSVNRNWITTDNVDLTWDCIRTEILSVNRELSSWSGSSSSSDTGFDWEAQEQMLRGCVGLDVTAFLFMAVFKLLLLLKAQLPFDQLECDTDEIARMKREKDRFDLSRLRHALAVLFEDEQICLVGRLSGTLSSPVLGREAVDMATLVVEQAGALLFPPIVVNK